MITSFLLGPAPWYYRLLLPLALLALWQYVAVAGVVDLRLVPAPFTVAERFWTEFKSGSLVTNVAWSLGRNLVGFTIGSILGVGLGMLLGLSRAATLVLGPSFNTFKQIAIFAWIPLLSVWLGTGELAKIVFIAMGAFTPVVVNTWEGAASISKQHIEASRVLGFGPLDFLFKLALPSALPAIFTGLHLGLFYSWLATIGAEYFTNIAPGIGGIITAGRIDFDMPQVMVGVTLLGVIGYVLNKLGEALQHRVLRWQTR